MKIRKKLTMIALVAVFCGNLFARNSAAGQGVVKKFFDGYAEAKRHQSLFPKPPEMVPAGMQQKPGKTRWPFWDFAGTKIDAPILGNGDMLAAFAGPPEYPQFWVTSNDFWQMESNPNWEFFHDYAVAKYSPYMSLGSPRPLGRIVFEIPGLENAGYRAWQEFGDACTYAEYTAKGNIVRLKSWVAAQENILVVEFTADRQTAISAGFFFPNELGKGCDVGVDFEGLGESDEILVGTFVGLIGGKTLQIKDRKNRVIYGYREFSDQVDVPVKAAFAGKFLGADSSNVAIDDGDKALKAVIVPGETLYFVLPLRSWAKVSRPLEYARSRAGWITSDDLDELWKQHTLWWKDFWQVSGVQLEDTLIEQRYYLSQYMMGSLSRDPDYPPNILGISTFDRMMWNGNYKINYNHQSPYLGLLASGHFRQSDPHDAPYLAMMDIGREMSQRLLGHKGVYLPLGLGPVGMVSEPLLLNMKSPAIHGAINMIMRYKLTMDNEYLKKVYPFLKSVADFWEYDLVLRDGKYNVVGDGFHERAVSAIDKNAPPLNPTNTLGYLKTFFREMSQISRELEIDADRRETWLNIADNLAPYRIGTINAIEENLTLWNEKEKAIRELVPKNLWNVPVFFNEEVGSAWSTHFPANIMQIYPAGAIGLNSPEEELTAARNTIHALSCMEEELGRLNSQNGDFDNYVKPVTHPHFYRKGAWNAENLDCLFFPAAVRVGYDPEKIWNELRQIITYRGLPNGFIDRNPHGIEKLSTVPNTVQEMMLLSHEGVLRFFRVWPGKSQPNAAFEGLWAYGAFVVGATLRNGVVSSIRIESKKGSTCTVENPWKGKNIRITGSNGELLLSGDIFSFDTVAGGIYYLESN
ncbi:MAG: hypothetical protein LBE91_20850 [Tannerella sp.]|jgi:hypothetical protein|nr:hypothetical protein [Tannerella sp.]